MNFYFITLRFLNLLAAPLLLPPLPCHSFCFLCQFFIHVTLVTTFIERFGQKNVSPSSCVSIFLLSPMLEKTIGNYLRCTLYFCFFCLFFIFFSLLCYCICRNRKGHLDHVCDKKIEFCICIWHCFIIFCCYYYCCCYRCCCCSCSCYACINYIVRHTPETETVHKPHESFIYWNWHLIIQKHFHCL